MSRVVIVGGGIAGVSTARALAARGRDVLLLERGPGLGLGSSAASASIFRLALTQRVNVDLALRSADIGRELSADGYVETIGTLYSCTDEAQRRAILEASEHAGVVEVIGGNPPSLLSPFDGVIDAPGLIDALANDARTHGAELRCNAAVTAFERTAGRVSGVVVGGESIAGDVVDCTGAWSPGLSGGAARAIRPHRRHIFILEQLPAFEIQGIVWDLTENLYLRREARGILACPCDETPMPASDAVATDAAAEELLREKLERFAPMLAGASVVTSWAGLRPLTQDDRFVVGADPREPGLFLVGGFGGHGMTGGPAAGELAAALLCGERPEGADALDPSRLV